MRQTILGPALAICILANACSQSEPTLFELVEPDKSGVLFNNLITEDDTFNILKEEYVYNGGGVGIGDFNNDGLEDIYFTGNMVDNALYINQGDMEFADITKTAGVAGKNCWSSGVAVVDINGDDWEDIYVSNTIYKEPSKRENLLYINQGTNEEGIPVFVEKAEAYGLADDGNTTQAAFFDYDLDGDLDVYLLTNVIDTKLPGSYREKITDGTSINNDRLYRNNGMGPDGHPTFTNVTEEAGIIIEGFGLGITVSDINLDGWPDIYVSNDYLSNDLLYINNQDGTFSNRIEEYLSHTSHSAMGSDVVDFNNDAMVDIVALDMLPENNQRQKQMLGPNNYMSYINNERFEYQHQYVRNTLQLNQGMSPKGHPVFGEIAQLAGIYQTDWSWTPLVADFDNDGYKDIIITNGFPKDVTDRDFASYRSGPAGNVASPMYLQTLIPVVKIANYAYHNQGNKQSSAFTFADKTKEWGMDIPSFSNGAAYVDLDNDGGLDVVVNNINDPAFIYANQTNDGEEKLTSNYLKIMLSSKGGSAKNLGAKVLISYGRGKSQLLENARYRGYLSSMGNELHFGLGDHEKIDSIEIYWPGGKYQLLTDLKVNKTLMINYEDATVIKDNVINQEFSILNNKTLLTNGADALNINFKHTEEDKIDFNLQRTIPLKYTQMGPSLAVGDANGDGLDDFYIGGSANENGGLFIQQQDGTFATPQQIDTEQEEYEDSGSLFFDADDDGDQDLYIASGSYEFLDKLLLNQDRLYINDGRGNYAYKPEALPKFNTVSSAVRAADYDRDGDLDLFVGGRIIPGAYPKPANSHLLQNDGGKFADVTNELIPELTGFGLVSDGLWTDFNQDGRIDLIVAAEWKPLTFFANTENGFVNVTETTGINNNIGWWSSLAGGDFDQDGDTDYIAGNLGLNSAYQASKQYPISVYAKDFDDNGGYDAIMVKYIKDEDGVMRPYPMHSLDVMLSQMIGFKRKYQKYEQYGKATIDSLLTSEMKEGALLYKANHMASSYIENLGNGKFSITPLPMQAQIAPLFGMLSQDVDNDGHLDILLVGNNYGSEVFSGRHDAFKGLYMKGDGKGNFDPESLTTSGFYVPKDGKALVEMISNNHQVYLASQNQDSLVVMRERNPTTDRVISLEKDDAWAIATTADGRQQRLEFYYGEGYLSQSSRQFVIGKHITNLRIYDYRGNMRSIEIGING